MGCPICPGCVGPYPGPARSGLTLSREDDVRADKRYYLNADRSRVVDEHSPDAAYLLAAEGDDITNEDVKRYGLGARKQAEEKPEPEAKSEETPAETKMQPAPPENKAVPAPKATKDK